MIKFFLMLMSICFFIPAHAAAAHKLNVDILNLGAENCKLTKSEVLHGTILEGNIPQYLPGTGMVMHFGIGVRNSPSYPAATTDAELYLTYECGSEKHITLYMKQIYKHKQVHGSMVVKMTDAIDVHETHEVSPSSREEGIYRSKNHPGYIRWMLWN